MSGHDRPQNWSFSQGTGLTPAQREAQKPHVAVLALATRFAYHEQSEFPTHVAAVGEGENPMKVARAYGNGRRREVIASLLRGAVDAGCDPDRLVQIIFRRAFWIPDEVTGRGAYAYRPEFQQMIDAGAIAVMRRGAGRCLECGNRLAADSMRGFQLATDPSRHGRVVRRDYCCSHQSLQGGSMHEWTEHAVSKVFKWSREAQQAAGYLPGR